MITMKDLSKKHKNILFSFWDGGFGHINRLIPVAKKFYNAGYKVGFICSRKYVKYLNIQPFIDELFVLENRKERIHTPLYELPVYSHAFRHSQRLKGLEFDDTEFLDSLVKKELDIISYFRPDLIINDYRDTIRITSEILGIPLIGITKSNGNTAGYNLGWWVDIPDDLILPDCRTSFNIVRDKYKLLPIKDEREIFEGDLCLVPSSPTIDPLPNKRDTDHYVGVLNEISENPLQRFSLKRKNENPMLFWYLGEGNNRPYVDFDSIVCEISDKTEIAIALAGPEDRYAKLYRKAETSDRIITKPFFSPNEYSWILDNASVIVNQGGSTAMLGLSKGIPVITIPWNSEPNMAYFIDQYGAGINLAHSLSPLERRSADDLGKDVEIMGHWHSNIDFHHINQAIYSILKNLEYRIKANELSKELKGSGGSNKVLDLAKLHFL